MTNTDPRATISLVDAESYFQRVQLEYVSKVKQTDISQRHPHSTPTVSLIFTTVFS